MSPSYRKYQQEKLLSMMFKSVRKIYPDCRCVILTDTKSKIQEEPDIKVIAYEVDVKLPQVAIYQARLEFLKQADASSHIVFLDTDMLVQRSLDAIFEKDFHICLTYILGRKYPINAGIMFIHRQGIIQAIKFFEILLKFYLERYPGWTWNIRYAFRDVIGKHNFKEMPKEILNIQGIKIMLVPCDLYNYSSEDGHPMDEYSPEKFVLHFKGPRKPDMISYFKRYLEQC